MNTESTQPNNDSAGAGNGEPPPIAAGLPGDVADLLVSRVVDGVATERDWNAFQVTAGSDVKAWRELAMNLGAAQRDQSALTRAVEAQVSAAHLIDLPSDDAAIPMTRASKAWNFARSGLGWVAAAALAVAVYTGRFNQTNPATHSLGTPHQAGLGQSLTDYFDSNKTQTTDIFNAYMDRGMASGEVLGELPDKLMVQAQPVKLADGSDGYEVVFVRQILERRRLPDLYQMQVGPIDELGRSQLTPVPMRITKPRKGST